MHRHADRAELLDRLVRERARLDVLLDRLTPAEVTEPGVVGDWSVKDLLAHLVAHEQRALEEVRLALRGECLAIDHAANDAFNAQAVAASKEQPFGAVREAWNGSSRDVAALVAALPEAAFDPAGPVAAALGDSIDGALGYNTYAHYAEHRQQIEAWLRGVRGCSTHG
jgi:hypothetical protein